jgi:peptidoglycan/xylan/chitin deacetylase (PgdA/CDA1 family)
LEREGCQGTFFMVGAQAQKHSELVAEVRRRGHSLGNHTMNHEKGWNVQASTYLQSVQACDAVLCPDGRESRLFRPPYGKFTPRQASAISRQKKAIMWDVLAGDYLGAEYAQDVLARLKECTRPGSIVVMHDSPKAWPVLQQVLPEYLSWLAKQGLVSRSIPDT